VPAASWDISIKPKIAARTAPMMPIAIRIWAPRANGVGSSAKNPMMSKTMLAVHVPIGMVTRMGWKGCP
jgi:hypothetical protein